MYGYRRVWALLRRQTELDGMAAINAKRVYRIMQQNALLLECKPVLLPSKRAMRSPESNGIAESFVKTIKRYNISIMPKPDVLTAAKNLRKRSNTIMELS